MDFFLLKKFLGALMMPLPVTLILMFIGWVGLLRNKRRTALTALTLSLLLLVVSTTHYVPNILLEDVERRYPQFDLDKHVDYIVILGCGHTNDAALPLSAQLHPCSMMRIAEAMRIYQHNPTARFITSGATGSQTFSNAEMNKRMLMAMGIPADVIIAVEKSRDTEDEARNLAQMLRNQDFVLVTSASHMRRAMGLFEAQGLSPVPAPSEHLVRYAEQPRFWSVMPRSTSVQKLERWWYETLGRTWLAIKGWFS